MNEIPETIELLNEIYKKAGDVEIQVNCKELYPALISDPGFISRLQTLRNISLIRFNEYYDQKERKEYAYTVTIRIEGLQYLENNKYIIQSLGKTDKALTLTRKSMWITLGALIVSILMLGFMIYSYL